MSCLQGAISSAGDGVMPDNRISPLVLWDYEGSGTLLSRHETVLAICAVTNRPYVECDLLLTEIEARVRANHPAGE